MQCRRCPPSTGVRWSRGSVPPCGRRCSQSGGIQVAEHRARSRGEHGGQPATLAGEPRTADAVDAGNWRCNRPCSTRRVIALPLIPQPTSCACETTMCCCAASAARRTSGCGPSECSYAASRRPTPSVWPLRRTAVLRALQLSRLSAQIRATPTAAPASPLPPGRGGLRRGRSPLRRPPRRAGGPRPSPRRSGRARSRRRRGPAATQAEVEGGGAGAADVAHPREQRAHAARPERAALGLVAEAGGHQRPARGGAVAHRERRAVQARALAAHGARTARRAAGRAPRRPPPVGVLERHAHRPGRKAVEVVDVPSSGSTTQRRPLAASRREPSSASRPSSGRSAREQLARSAPPPRGRRRTPGRWPRTSSRGPRAAAP